MSFILEALKKSEQQRQQQNNSRQQVRKRTLSLPSRQAGRRPYWILAGLLSLLILCGWWLFSKPEPVMKQSSAVSRPTTTPVPVSQPVRSEPAVPVASIPDADSTTAIALQPQSVAAEPAPVPRNLASFPTASSSATAQQSYEPSATTPVIDEVLLGSASAQLPLYLDLSKDLRDRMPPLSMSMHFYTASPGSRMVRINNHLLHEGDWLSSDLQIVEITPTGATLDFPGKLFEIRSSGR